MICGMRGKVEESVAVCCYWSQVAHFLPFQHRASWNPSLENPLLLTRLLDISKRFRDVNGSLVSWNRNIGEGKEGLTDYGTTSRASKNLKLTSHGQRYYRKMSRCATKHSWIGSASFSILDQRKSQDQQVIGEERGTLWNATLFPMKWTWNLCESLKLVSFPPKVRTWSNNFSKSLSNLITV
jgi:hypothetical protein